jgi:hypothetical protein
MNNLEEYGYESEDFDPVEDGQKLMDNKFQLTVSPRAKVKGDYYGDLEESEMLRQKQSENDPLKEFYDMQRAGKAET